MAFTTHENHRRENEDLAPTQPWSEYPGLQGPARTPCLSKKLSEIYHKKKKKKKTEGKRKEKKLVAETLHAPAFVPAGLSPKLFSVMVT